MKKTLPFALIGLALGLSPIHGHADQGRFGAHDVVSLFAIGKNVNRDEVHYGIRLDKDCMPVGKEPIYAYWRDFEQGPDVVEDLNLLDRTVYGVDGQWVTKRSLEESKVLMALKATKSRGIAVLTRKREGRCVAESIATIGGKPARLERVFVHVPGFLRVDWIEIRGVDVASGKQVVERVDRW